MAIVKNVMALATLLAFCGCAAQREVEEAIALANEVDAKTDTPPVEAQTEADAKNAHTAAKVAKEAAKVATKVAVHSAQITELSKHALRHAHNALHRARVSSEGLSRDQRKSLRKAEKKLRDATQEAEYGEVKKAKYVDKKKTRKELEDKMNRVKVEKENSEIEEMRKEIKELRNRLKKKGDKSDDEALKELQKKLEEMEAAEKKEDKVDTKSHDEMKAEIERLREQIEKLKDEEALEKSKAEKTGDSSSQPVPVEKESLDIDSEMPFGDLEPFGREDTAQELTEDSILESDKMVDQLERAEIAEEKRAVFRALTRLRGAAITSFDGVARSQTGNIDHYNRNHQWRNKHPIHHLADEESDISKWAFPDNAD